MKGAPTDRRIRLIVNADDFGFFDGVSRGILEAVKAGTVTATGVMANGPAFERWLAPLLASETLDVGVHLNATLGRPLTAWLSAYLDRWSGKLPGKVGLARAILTHRIPVDAIAEEWRAQIEKCAACGLRLRFLNSHEHVHMAPSLYPVAMGLAREFGITHVRYTRGEWDVRGGISGLSRSLAIALLGFATRDEAKGPRLLGFTRSGSLSAEDLRAIVARLRPGEAYELMCHPGHADACGGEASRRRCVPSLGARACVVARRRNKRGVASFLGAIDRLSRSRARRKPRCDHEPSPRLQKSVSSFPPTGRRTGSRRWSTRSCASWQSVDMDFEIIIVDDGSPDGTFRRVQEICRRDRRVRGLRFSRNFGKEAALLAGLKAATGDAVVTIDADLQHPPDADSGADPRVAGWRENRECGQAEPWPGELLVARWGADLFNASISKLGGIDLRNSSDFKLLDRQAVDAVVKLLPERQRFFRGLADWIGFHQVSIPFDVAERRADRSSWPLGALFQLAFTALVSFTSAPLRIVAWLGILAMGVGVVIAADALWSWLHGNAVSGFATTIMTLLLLGSSIMISLGIIGEYIAKIYDEVKGRPAYLIESTCGEVVESVGRAATC